MLMSVVDVGAICTSVRGELWTFGAVVPLVGDVSPLDHEGKGEQHESGEEGEHSEEVGGVHVLLGLEGVAGAHNLLTSHTAESGESVGEHRANESEHAEANVALHGRVSDTADDGDEAGVDLPGEELAEDEAGEEGGKDGLEGLDDLHEGDGASTKADDGRDVGAEVAESDGSELHEVLGRELGHGAETTEPVEAVDGDTWAVQGGRVSRVREGGGSEWMWAKRREIE